MLAGHTDPDPQGFVESSCSEVVSDIIIFFFFSFLNYKLYVHGLILMLLP